jgi:hypothetical protein
MIVIKNVFSYVDVGVILPTVQPSFAALLKK